MTYDETVNMRLEGNTIVKAEVNGFGVRLELSDGSVFDFDASDGGHSLYEFDDD